VIVFALVLALARASNPAQEPQADALAALEDAERRLLTLRQQIRDIEARSAELDVRAAQDAARLTAAEQALGERRALSTRRLASWYRLQRRGVMRLLFNAKGPVEMRRRSHYLDALVAADESAARDLVAARDAARAASEQVRSDQRMTAELRRDLDERKVELERQVRVRRQAVAVVRADATLAARWDEARAADAYQAVGGDPALGPDASPQDDGRAFAAARGGLPRPVSGRVVRGWGPYTDNGATVQNLGVDYAAAVGTVFTAVSEGIVTRAAFVRGFGQVVTVQHGPYATLYAHARELNVATGQRVRTGQVLGTVGTAGLGDNAEGRLHFEIRYNGTAQDPAEWIGR
jgi:septal ring factor EnvC (AmiA/AmiB activator)